MIIISGLARCGSSLVCQMLAAGGVDVVGTHPMYEHPLASQPLFDGDEHAIEWLASLAPYQAVKLLSPNLCSTWPLPGLEGARVIWCDREVREQAKSIEKWARSRACASWSTGMSGAPWTREMRARCRSMLKSQRYDATARLRQAFGSFTLISFESTLRAPNLTADMLRHIVGVELDVDAMAAVVKNRRAKCLPGFLEVGL